MDLGRVHKFVVRMVSSGLTSTKLSPIFNRKEERAYF